ncbi:MAG: spore coat U domain-containing protein [Sphingomonas fennica]
MTGLSAASAVSCGVTTAPANFGVYNPLSAAAATTTGTVEVACTCTVVDCVAFAYRVEMTAGQSGNAASREMRGPSGKLLYNLYQDSNHSAVWGSAASSYSVIYLLALFGSSQKTTVFARAPAGQKIRAGTYSDNVMVTITY